MYEAKTFESILEAMLTTVRGYDSTIDTRKSSVIYNALAPAAVELQNAYIQLDTVLDETFADTATRTYLVKRAAERGIVPTAATKAVLQGEFNQAVSVGDRFSLDALNYIVTEYVSDFVYKLECETAGIVGNSSLGSLIPIVYAPGLTSAELTALLIPGEDEEGTEVFRARYFASIGSQAFGGNQADYTEKTNALDGVGGTKVYPTPGGVGGTVGLTIIDSTYGVPSSALIAAVQDAVDPSASAGEGVGFAPIDHVVTVSGVSAVSIDITFTVTFQSGWMWADIEAAVQAMVDTYLLELTTTWANSSALIVRVSQIETRMLNLAGVIDITGTTINGTAANHTLGADEIPERGAITNV